MHNKTPKIAAINDLTGFGRCSLTVTLPIISAMGIQCCPVPTSIFSNHPAFGHHYKLRLNDELKEYFSHWEQIGLTFDAIYSGFLVSVEQIRMVKEALQTFSNQKTKIVVDPVMGDNGRLYCICTQEMCEEMKQLVALADIITPNLTEACYLTDTPYREGDWTEAELIKLTKQLSALGAKKIVVSGIPNQDKLQNALYDEEEGFRIITVKKSGANRSGTGDVFASMIAAETVLGMPFTESVQRAVEFIQEAVAFTDQFEIPETDGLYIEPLLGRFTQRAEENRNNAKE